MTPAQIQQAMAVPYADLGLGLDGWNCWGLTRWAFEQFHGIRLTGFAGVTADQRASTADAAESVIVSGDFSSVDQPAAGDVACAYLITDPPILRHVGFIVQVDGRLMVLHINRGRPARLSSLQAFARAYPMVKWWRHG